MSTELGERPSTAPTMMELARMVIRFNVRPELRIHPSWLPQEWPSKYRRPERLGAAGQAVLADMLRARTGGPQLEFNFDSRMRRVALLDLASLRRLAIYTGFCAHSALFRSRTVGIALRRQADRIDADGAQFVMQRLPELSELKMESRAIRQRPVSAGRVMVTRGYRLLLGTMAAEGEMVYRAVQWKLPRRVASYSVPQLSARQILQLREVMLMCIMPERLPQWDWLF